jgi:transposase
VLEDASNELSGTARLAVQEAFVHWRELDDKLLWCDQQIGRHVRLQRRCQAGGQDHRHRRADGLGHNGQCERPYGAQFGAWLGLVPSQNSSGGNARLGRITKRGDDYLRTLLIQGAKSAVMSPHRRDDPTSRWLVQLKDRVGWQKACVAMANESARILWAVMTREATYDRVAQRLQCGMPLFMGVGEEPVAALRTTGS